MKLIAEAAEKNGTLISWARDVDENAEQTESKL